MNRFWIVLTVLFSMNLMISVSVSADFFFRNGIESYQKGIRHYENKRYNEGDNSFEDSIEFLEEAIKKKLAPSQKNQAHLRLGISRYYVGKTERAIESLNSALRQGELNDKHQAEAHFYWGMSLLAIRKHPEAREQFEKALKLNSSLKFPPSLEHERRAKNLFEEARERLISVDETPPTIHLPKPNDGATFNVNQPITISAKVTDNISVKEVRVHVSPTRSFELFEEGSSGIYARNNITSGTSGTYQYHLTATDEAGNESRYPKTGKLRIIVTEEPGDVTPPTITLLKPHDGATFNVNKLITISAKVTDGTSVKEVYAHFPSNSYELSKEPTSDIYTKVVWETGAGTLRYHLTATDEAGNESRYPKTGKLKIILIGEPGDKTPPIIRLLKPNDGATFEINQRITITAEVTDGTSVKEVYAHFPSNSYELSKEPTSDIYTKVVWGKEAGTFRYYLTVTDEAGNESRYPKTGKLRIIVTEEPDDETAPIIRLLKPYDGATFKANQPITIEAKVTEDTSVKEVYVHFPSKSYELSKERSSDIYTKVIWATDAGTLRYYLTATDEAGNESRYPKTGKLRISVTAAPGDETAPIIRRLEPYDGATFNVNQRITIRAEVTDNISVDWVRLHYGFSQSNSLGPSEYHSKILTKTSLGIYTGYIPLKGEAGYICYYLTATDKAGNERKSEVRWLKIAPTTHPVEQPLHREIWAAWSTDVFKGRVPVFDLDRGGVFSLAGLYERKGRWTLGAQLDFSYQNTAVPYRSSWTGHFGVPLGRSPIMVSIVGGVSEYGRSDSATPILGASLKGYLGDRVAIDTTGSIHFRSIHGALDNEESIEVGIRIYFFGSRRASCCMGVKFSRNGCSVSSVHKSSVNC